MIYSGNSLRNIQRNRDLLDPFEPESLPFQYGDKTLTYGVSHAGYDIRLSLKTKPIAIIPGFTYLFHSLERFRMPRDVVGEVKDKSTLARMGVQVQNTVIEPGWQGWLTLELTFSPVWIEQTLVRGPDRVFLIKPGMPIAQVLFYQMDEDVPGYDGKYQNQPDEPQEAL